MNTFPNITRLSEVETMVSDIPEFIIIDKGDYTVIDYVFQDTDTFDNPYARECRGLTFDIGGRLIRRPLHKFFNLGEKGDDKIDLDNLLIVEKLDGSMIAPMYINGYMRLGTRKGITETALNAEVFIANKPAYKVFIDRCEYNNVTPIFEWLDADNPNVIEYPHSDLILLAMRDKTTGEYLDRTETAQQANSAGIPIARAYRVDNFDKFVEETRSLEGEEGYVVHSGKTMIKLKSDWYVRLHRVKDSTRKPRNIVKLILENELDDILPVLDDESRKKIEDFRASFSACMGRLHREVIAGYDDYMIRFGGDRKEFAINATLPDYIKRGVYFILDNKGSLVYVKDMIMRATKTDKEFEEFNKNVLQMEGV